MMEKFILVLFFAMFVNARWSINYGTKHHDEHEHDELDWWEHSVFYQVSVPVNFVETILIEVISRSTQDHLKTAMAMEMEI